MFSCDWCHSDLKLKCLPEITEYFMLCGVVQKLAGMTGTAKTEASEFSNIYKLEAIVVPTNVPTKRTDNPDVVFGKEQGVPAPVPW